MVIERNVKISDVFSSIAGTNQKSMSKGEDGEDGGSDVSEEEEESCDD